MTWTWTSAFENFQDGWLPDNNGFGDLALYVAGTGFVSVDGQSSAISFDRVVQINITIASTTINSIEVNYNYEGGTFSTNLFGLQVTSTLGIHINIISSNMINGDNQSEFTVVGGDVTFIQVALRCSKFGTPVYSGVAELNFIRIKGEGQNPFDNNRNFTSPSKFIEDAGGGASGGIGGGYDNMADISADGLNIYMAAFNVSGEPILIRLLAALTTDGSIVFDPGAGGRIGVECGTFNADHVWVAGEFDGTNTVEKSENAGSSFTVKDNGAFGTIRTFKVGPDSDNRIMLFDGDNGDIIESIDGGETWTTINASVTPLVNSIVRYGVNVEELIAGNQGAANDSIDYSPNSGVNLEDYQTGVYPNADCTKVITN